MSGISTNNKPYIGMSDSESDSHSDEGKFVTGYCVFSAMIHTCEDSSESESEYEHEVNVDKTLKTFSESELEE